MSERTRRAVLRLGVASAAFLARPGYADEALVPRLIEEARAFGAISDRIAHISRALLGTPYIGSPLGGGPQKAERFIVREDGFDCVTFCETVLAAARSRGPDEFAAELRNIRYRNGEIGWFTRNHYFVEWISNNVANGVCRIVALPGAVRIRKILNSMRSLADTPVDFVANPRARVFENGSRIRTGDIVAFVSRRSGLDVFHTGFIVRERDETLWLRHASKSRGCALDQPLAQFCAVSGVRAMTLSRPQETVASDMIV